MKTVNEAGGNSIARPHSVNDVRDVVVRALQEFAAVMQAGRPAIRVGATALAQRDRLVLQVGKCGKDLFGESLVLSRVDPAALDLALVVLRVHGNAKSQLAIL